MNTTPTIRTRSGDGPRSESRRRAPAPVACRRRPDAERAGWPALLQGVRQPDRAREDAPDAGHDRLARRPSRHRPGTWRAASPSTSAAASRRRSPARTRSRWPIGRDEALARVRDGLAGRALDRLASSSRRARSRARPGRASWRGEVRAGARAARARSLARRGPGFSDLDRADVLFRLGVCRYKLQSVSTAIGLFNEALTLAERSELPSDQLRSEILGWRSRCYRRQRDLEAAREDVERGARALAGARGSPQHRDTSLPGVARRRAARPPRPGAHVRRAGEGAVRAARRRGACRPAAEQPRRPEPHARALRAGGREPEDRVCGRARARHRRRRRDRSGLAGARPPRPRRVRRGRTAARSRDSSFSTTVPTTRRDRECPARAGTRSHGTGSTGRS